jgi:hypothetical protein
VASDAARTDAESSAVDPSRASAASDRRDGRPHTLKLVARYPDACDLFDGPERKLQVLRAHAEAVDGDDRIKKTFVFHMDPGPREKYIDALPRGLRKLDSLGLDLAIGTARGGERLGSLELTGRGLIPDSATFHVAGRPLESNDGKVIAE